MSSNSLSLTDKCLLSLLIAFPYLQSLSSYFLVLSTCFHLPTIAFHHFRHLFIFTVAFIVFSHAFTYNHFALAILVQVKPLDLAPRQASKLASSALVRISTILPWLLLSRQPTVVLFRHLLVVLSDFVSHLVIAMLPLSSMTVYMLLTRQSILSQWVRSQKRGLSLHSPKVKQQSLFLLIIQFYLCFLSMLQYTIVYFSLIVTLFSLPLLLILPYLILLLLCLTLTTPLLPLFFLRSL